MAPDNPNWVTWVKRTLLLEATNVTWEKTTSDEKMLGLHKLIDTRVTDRIKLFSSQTNNYSIFFAVKLACL